MVHDRVCSTRRSACIVAALFCFLVAAPFAAAEDFRAGALRFEQCVPDDCYFFASFEGLAAGDAAFEGTGLAKTWREEEVRSFVRELESRMHEHLSRHPLPQEAAALRSILQGRVAIAVGDLTMVALRVPTPAFVLAIDTGNKTREFHGMLSEVLGELSQTGIRPQTIQHGGREIQSIPIPNAPFTSVCFTQVDNLFLVGLNKYYLGRVLDHHASGKGVLAANDSFRRGISHAQSAKVMSTIFFNIDGVKSRIGGLAPPEITEVVTDLGLDAIRSVTLVAAVDGTGARDTYYIDAPGQKRGFVKLSAPGPVVESALALAPESTVYFSQMNFDFAGAVDEALRLVDKYWPPARAQFEAGRSRIRERVGFDPHTEFLASLGQGISMSVSMPSNGGFVPDLLGTLHLEKPDVFHACVQKLLDRAGAKRKSLDFEGNTLYYMSVNSDVPFTPTYAIVDDTFYCAGTPLMLKEALRNRARDGKSLASNATFRAAQSKLSSRPKASLEYVDLPRVVGLCYATGAPFLQVFQGRVDEAGIPIDLALLPTTEALTRNLDPLIRAYSTDKNGMVGECFAPTGFGVVLAAASRFVNRLEGMPPVREMAGHFEGVELPMARARRQAMEAERARAEAMMQTERAEAAMQEARAARADAVREVERSRGADAGMIFQIAFDAHTAGHYERAREGFLHAAELGFETATCYYNVACGYALSAESDKALEWLEKAIDEGFANRRLLSEDSDLDSIRDTSRFKELAKRL